MDIRRRYAACWTGVFLLAVCQWAADAPVGMTAELVKLSEKNWDDYVPLGKEVDCIYGDYVLRNQRVCAIIARATDTRHANMTVKHVAGAVIDLVERSAPSDQLSCYYPLGVDYKLTGPVDWPAQFDHSEGAAHLAFRAVKRGSAETKADALRLVVGYSLGDKDDNLRIETLISNRSDVEKTFSLTDAIRADGEIKAGHLAELNAWWCDDAHWRGAYVLRSNSVLLQPVKDEQRPYINRYVADSNRPEVTIRAGDFLVLRRTLIPGSHLFDVFASAFAQVGQLTSPVRIEVRDGNGPIDGALVSARRGEQFAGRGRTNPRGVVDTRLPPGEYHLEADADGRPKQQLRFNVTDGANDVRIKFDALPAKIVGAVTDGEANPIACKVAFFGRNVPNPNFGPDSAVHGVRNLWYAADGKFEVKVLPGEYQVLMSHGPEYDAVSQIVKVESGKTTRIVEQLPRTVDTRGWISAELHSHSSPSGDNNASQRGRVLNLLAEHLEFIPCTEHQRISTYLDHLKHFEATERVLTCPGMELTGSPLPINHQNAFPLAHKPRTQDGGAPVTDVNPVVQIARLAMWDDESDKVVQINHPNIPQLVGDANLDGRPDEGFRKMLHYADVIEVHPLGTIFDVPPPEPQPADEPGSRVQNWLRLLNLGQRIPGVVNTDAHWNFHGSGWLRNYVRCTTDDPAAADLDEVCKAIERGQIVMTNGPFLEVEATAGGRTAGPGDDLAAEGDVCTLAVRVECANWLDVNRVQIFINGHADKSLNFTRRTHREMFGDGTIKFNQTLKAPLTVDAHIVVAAAGEGLQLGRVYGEAKGRALPIAVSNPIFVDFDGGGFQASGDPLGAPLPASSGTLSD